MGLFDAFKGLLSGDGVQGVLESTGLGDHVDGLLGDAGALTEALGVDLGQVTESLGIDRVAESLPGGLGGSAGDALGGMTETATP